MIEAIVYTQSERPITSGKTVLKGQNDAKEWCRENAEFEDDMWVVLENGKVVGCGTIDEMNAR
jgi:hypothetical protein